MADAEFACAANGCGFCPYRGWTAFGMVPRHFQRSRTKTVEARSVESVFGWFTEGFDTADLKEAKALLDELS